MSSTEPNFGQTEKKPVKLLLEKNEVIQLRQSQLSDGRDLEQALSAAERLLGEAEERHRHEQNRTFTIWSFIIAVVVALAASLVATRSLTALLYSLVPVFVSIVLLVVLLIALRDQYRRSEFNLQMRLATRLAAMINETYMEVAEREQWSYLRREATKIRLSAFPLDHGGLPLRPYRSNAKRD